MSSILSESTLYYRHIYEELTGAATIFTVEIVYWAGHCNSEWGCPLHAPSFLQIHEADICKDMGNFRSI
jgi:hypothetical protein